MEYHRSHHTIYLFFLMPRLPIPAILRAYQQDHLLPLLLRECRTHDSAQNELRWLREWAVQKSSQRTNRFGATGWRSYLRSMCRERARGVPLQYILGDQPFGDLEILCRKGVLIPRYACRQLHTVSSFNHDIIVC